MYPVSTLPSRHLSQCPGSSIDTPANIVSGAGTIPHSRKYPRASKSSRRGIPSKVTSAGISLPNASPVPMDATYRGFSPNRSLARRSSPLSRRQQAIANIPCSLSNASVSSRSISRSKTSVSLAVGNVRPRALTLIGSVESCKSHH